MQASQIKKGEFYAETRDKDIFGWGTPRKVEVLETHVEKRPRSWGNPTIGCTIRIHPREGDTYEGWVPNRQIKMPWDEYAAERERRNAAAKRHNEARDARRLERAEAAMRLDSQFRAAGVQPEQHYAGHSLTRAMTKAGFEVNEQGYVTTVFTNLSKHIEAGEALLVKANAVAGHDLTGGDA